MICRICKVEKPSESFSWKNRLKKIKRNVCKECHNFHYGRPYYKKNKKQVISRISENRRKNKREIKSYLLEYFKTHPCAECGNNNPIVLEFDHLDRRFKKLNVGTMVGVGYTLRAIKREISKCQVLCANCHRIKTAYEQGWTKTLTN